MDAPAAQATAATDELERQLRHASFFVQASLEQHGKLTGKLDVYLTSLIEVLMDRGLIEAEDLAKAVDANRETHEAESRAKFETDGTLPAWPTVMVRHDDPDEPLTPEVEVDCEARMHICQAVCCSLPFPLSAAEVEAGDVKWDLGHPYVIRQTSEGYCVHNQRDNDGRCDVYHKRPGVCRGYSCAHDERIWSDFENMVLNHEYLDKRRRADFKFRPATGEAVSVTIRPPRRREPAAS
jgi:hypothetical protein